MHLAVPKEWSLKEVHAVSKSLLNVSQLCKAISAVVDHYWQQEYEDYATSSEQVQRRHVFHALVELNTFLVATENLEEDGISFDLIAGNTLVPKRTVNIHRVVYPVDELLTRLRRKCSTPDAPAVLTKTSKPQPLRREAR